MSKADRSLHQICIAAIRRHSKRSSGYLLTTLFEDGKWPSELFLSLSPFSIEPNEVPIFITTLDSDNWTLLTTRQLISVTGGIAINTAVQNIISWKWNDFKDERQQIFIGTVHLKGNSSMSVVIETGEASMISIYGIMTLRNLCYEAGQP